MSDWYSKLLLTVIAAAAAVIATQELRSSSRGVDEGRFRLQVIPMARMMLRIDSQTGQTWKSSFPEPRVWTPIADDPADVLDDGREDEPTLAPDAKAEDFPATPEPAEPEPLAPEPGAEAAPATPAP